MKPRPARARAYTLIEALVASSVLMIGISAAASLSLSLVTQEEISERSDRALGYLDNVVALHRAGVPATSIAALLPPEPVVQSLNFFDSVIGESSIGGLGPAGPAVGIVNPAATIVMSWAPSPATTNPTLSESGKFSWTGGKETTVRTVSVQLMRPTSASGIAAP